MRRLLPTLMAAAALTLAAPRPLEAQAPAPPAVADGQTVKDALGAWVEAFNSRDPQRIVALYAPNAVLWGTTAKTLASSPEQIWDYFKDAGQRPAVRVFMETSVSRAFGTIAVVSGEYTFADVKDGQRSNVRPARYTFVFQRSGDRWLIIDHHSSRVPAP